MTETAVEVEEGLNFITGSQSSNRTVDIVFVHGLRGHYKRTWHPQGDKLNSEDLEQQRNYFPYWLEEDIPDVGIWSYRYRAEPSNWSAKFRPGDPDLHGITMPLFDRAKNLIGALKNNEVGQRPLVFIAHSLGGLIVKKMLRDAYDTCGNPDNQTIINQTKGVVFIATPHQGSHLATLLGWLGNIAQGTITGQELEEHNPNLRELKEWYRFNSEKSYIDVKAMVFYETQQMQNITEVVNADSANPHLSEQVELIPINAHHISIAKPKSKTDDVYAGTRRFIKRLLPESYSQPLLQLPSTTTGKLPDSSMTQINDVNATGWQNQIHGGEVYQGTIHINKQT